MARQYEYWLELLQPRSSVEAKPDSQDQLLAVPTSFEPSFHAHVIYKGLESTSIPLETDFLIATPSAFLDAVPQLNLATLHTIGLDEADSMLYLPNTRFGNQKDAIKWQRHPPPLVGIMQELLGIPASGKSAMSRRGGTSLNMEHDHGKDKRLIVVSATANSVLRDWIVRRSGWIGSRGILGEKQLDWYDFAGSEQAVARSDAQHIEKDESPFQTIGRALLPNADVQHVYYLVDEKGMLMGAEAASSESLSRNSAPTKQGARSLEPLFTAAATLFALKRLTSALLVIPSTQSLTKTLDFLRALGVPATTVQEARDLPTDEPRLYVVSSSSVRGLDLPALEEIFILPGTVEDAQAYLHVAGRVGRMTAGQRRLKGRVCTLARNGEAREEGRVKRFWELLGIDGKLGELPRLNSE